MLQPPISSEQAKKWSNVFCQPHLILQSLMMMMMVMIWRGFRLAAAPKPAENLTKNWKRDQIAMPLWGRWRGPIIRTQWNGVMVLWGQEEKERNNRLDLAIFVPTKKHHNTFSSNVKPGSLLLRNSGQATPNWTSIFPPFLCFPRCAWTHLFACVDQFIFLIPRFIPFLLLLLLLQIPIPDVVFFFCKWKWCSLISSSFPLSLSVFLNWMLFRISWTRNPKGAVSRLSSLLFSTF